MLVLSITQEVIKHDNKKSSPFTSVGISLENTSFCIVIIFLLNIDIICKKSNTFPRSRNIFLYLTKHHFQYVTGCKLTKNSNRRGYSTERLNNCLKSEIHGIHKPPKIKLGAKVMVDKWKGKECTWINLCEERNKWIARLATT